MKVVNLEDLKLDQCLKDAQRQRVLLTRDGKPVALLVGVQRMDQEQLELGHSDKFWKSVRKWRKEKTISGGELEKRLRE